MGKPVVGVTERFEEYVIDGITVWKSNSVNPVLPERPISIDLGGWLFIGKRLVAKNAR